jgi:hypothetical protein
MYTYDKKKHVTQKTAQLADLVVSFLRVCPRHSTVNRFKPPPFKLPENQNKKLQKLFRMLVHTSTLINEKYRVKDQQGRYMSQKQDYINALNLMKDLVLYFDTRKGHYEHEILAIMEIIQEKNGHFTAKQLQEFTGYSRSMVKRIITTGIDKSWVMRTGGNRKAGYTYVLCG